MLGPDLMPFFPPMPFLSSREDPGERHPPGLWGPAKKFQTDFCTGVKRKSQALTMAIEKRAMLLVRRSHSGPVIGRGRRGYALVAGLARGPFFLPIAPGGENEGEITEGNLP